MTARAKSQPMCLLGFGYHEILMPLDAGLKVMSLLQGAVTVKDTFERGEGRYIVGDSVAVEMRTVQANELRMPAGEPIMPVRAAPRLLKGGA